MHYSRCLLFYDLRSLLLLPSRFLRRCLCRLSLCPLPFRGFGLRARLLRCGRLLLLGLGHGGLGFADGGLQGLQALGGLPGAALLLVLGGFGGLRLIPVGGLAAGGWGRSRFST